MSAEAKIVTVIIVLSDGREIHLQPPVQARKTEHYYIYTDRADISYFFLHTGQLDGWGAKVDKP